MMNDATLAVLCLLTTAGMLYKFRTPFASIIRSTINCNSTVLFHGRIVPVKVEVKQTRYRPGVAQRVPGS